MAKTNLDDLELKNAESAAAGRGDLTDQLARLKADLDAIAALVNELRDDHATFKTVVDDLKTAFNAHTHNADGGQAGSYFTSPPRTDAATVTLGTASEVTSSTPAALTAPAVTVTTK